MIHNGKELPYCALSYCVNPSSTNGVVLKDRTEHKKYPLCKFHSTIASGNRLKFLEFHKARGELVVKNV